ncbi:ig-like domain-containing protein, partial [Caerostris extrusa]
MSPLILRESDHKIDRPTKRRNMKLLAGSKRNPPSSTQAIGRGRKRDAGKSMSIDSSEKMPVVEDSELSLACITQGSSAMQVRWFKDDAAINVQTYLSLHVDNSSTKEFQRPVHSYSGFEKAHVLDS